MCNSLVCTIFDWLIVIGGCWLGLLVLTLATVFFWQLIKTILEGFKNDDW